MIFQRALRRELLSTAGAVFTTLFTIVITVMLIKILGQAAGGKVSSQDVLALIGFQALNYMPVILILTGFISVLLVITRSYQDSEMVVWFSAGLSLTRWVRPVLAFGWPLIVLTAVLSFIATPWANMQSAAFIDRFQKREDLARVSPGNFQESAAANRVFFVEGFSKDSTKVKNIFVSTYKDAKNSIVVAKEGERVTNADGDNMVVLARGRRYDGTPNQADFQMVEFDRYALMMGQQSPASASDQAARALPTSALLADRTSFNMSELLWRVSLPFMALSLMLLAVPLSFVNPRAGRSIGLIVALLIYVLYNSTIGIFQASVLQGRLSFMAAWWPAHLTVLAAALCMYAWRLKVNSPYHPLLLLGRFRGSVLSKRVVKP
ncbi:MAG: permease [Herbaspirillum sp.]|jgi:lipopolysaccharide export system permease protein|nr:permease [Herbaspirillum sp.]